MMFRLIGGAMVYGFALYGAVKFFVRPEMDVVMQPDAGREPAVDLAVDGS